MQETMSSPEGQATVDDLSNFATGGVSVLIGTTETNKLLMIAKTIKGRSVEDVLNSVEEVIRSGHKVSLAIVFVSIQQDYKELSKKLDSKGIYLFVSTTAGEFIDGTIEEHSITLMLLDLDRNYFKLTFLETGAQTTSENARQIGVLGKKTFTNPAFIIVSGWLSNEGENIVENISKGFGADVTIFGGMAGDDLSLSGPVVFTNNAYSD